MDSKTAEGLRKHPCCGGGSTPSQYGIPKNAIDLQDLIEYRKMNFAMGNIFKACYRLGYKDNDPLYEINKIIWFANRLKNEYERSRSITLTEGK